MNPKIVLNSVSNSNIKFNEYFPYGIQVFQSDGETWKTITIAHGISEHVQEPVGKRTIH